MNNIDSERFVYAFTGKTKDEYLTGIIKEWNDYLAMGGDPSKYQEVQAHEAQT